jgi:hypothetical protein
MPQLYRDFQSSVYDDLYRSIHRTFRLLRWRYALEGPHNPLQLTLDIQYSRDGQNWLAAPFTATASLEIRFERRIGQHDKDPAVVAPNVRDLSEGVVDEPTGHALFREAWEQRGLNRRSALVMGIAAAEVGLKECIVHLSPETRWLLDNVPSPPVDKMLAQYWKVLPKMPLANKQKLRIPRSLIKYIKLGIEMRNRIVHLGDEEIDHEELRKILESIRDVLFIFDCAQGHFWAIEYVRPEVRKEIASGSPLPR